MVPSFYVLESVPQVDPNMLDRHRGGGRGLDRSLAGYMLDREMYRLSRAEAMLDLRLGEALERLLAGGFEHLGYARAADYCRERLGIGARAAQLIRRMAGQMAKQPEIKSAFLAGRLSSAHCRLLLDRLPSLTGTAADWVDKAATLTVRGLAALLEEAIGGESAPDDDDAGLDRVAYEVSGAEYGAFLEAFELARRVAGEELTTGQVVEYMAAEYLAGRPLDDRIPEVAPPSIDDKAWIAEYRAHCRRVRESVEIAADGWPFLDHSPVWVALDTALDAPIPDDPLALDTFVRHLLLCRNRLAIALGRMLRLFGDLKLWRDAVFASIGHYATQRLGISRSTAAQYIRRDRTLITSPNLYSAVEEGRLTPSKVDLLIRIPDDYVEKWLDFAERHTCRALDAAISALELLKATDPGAYYRGGAFTPPAEGVQTFSPSPSAEPGSSVRVSVSLDPGAAVVLRAAQAAARAAAERWLTPEECLMRFVSGFIDTWGQADLAERAARRRVLASAGYRCMAPGCTARKNLHIHHIVFRSQGGGDEAENLVVLCEAHHQRHIHKGRMRLRRLPSGTLRWELGIRNGKPLAVYEGDRRVA